VVDPNALSAFLAVSNSNPAVGSVVQVSLQVARGSSTQPIGSFTLLLQFDTLRLAFVDQHPAPTGLVLTNVSNDTIRVAGADPGGFSQDQLVTFDFTVRGTDALKSLSFQVLEINSVAFADQLSRLVSDHTLH
jgi:hypothetical protein